MLSTKVGNYDTLIVMHFHKNLPKQHHMRRPSGAGFPDPKIDCRGAISISQLWTFATITSDWFITRTSKKMSQHNLIGLSYISALSQLYPLSVSRVSVALVCGLSMLSQYFQLPLSNLWSISADSIELLSYFSANTTVCQQCVSCVSEVLSDFWSFECKIHHLRSKALWQSS